MIPDKRKPAPELPAVQPAAVCVMRGRDHTLLATVLSADVVRFRYLSAHLDEGDFSYARVPVPAPAPDAFRFTVLEDRWELVTANLHISISSGLKVTIRNRFREVICEDETGFTCQENPDAGGYMVQCTKLRRDMNEVYLGLGDKSGRLNLAYGRYTLWNSDCYGYDQFSDPLYKSVPFFASVSRGEAWGIFFDNPFRSLFDFGATHQHLLSFGADGGEMDYYFIYGPLLRDVTARYTRLTGLAELPPLWALGYQQSKMSYYPQQEVLDIAAQLRKHRIPCDVLYLDFDHMEGYKSFTWDQERFPEPEQMLATLTDTGFHAITIVNPCVKIEPGYALHDEGLANGFFCRRADGPLTRATVWENLSYFPDFTRPKVRDWWGDQYTSFLHQGVSGFWNDMNEPTAFRGHEAFFPLDTRHSYDGHPCSHRKAHNIYGMQMSRATHEGLRRLQPDKRPFILSRATFAGGQRYAAVWTGDNVATWDHLWIANVQVQRLSVSGFSFAGSDIGGFLQEPGGELYLRWVQLAAFHPLMRTHSSGDTADQEPWSFGDEILALVKSAIELRYRLLPYLYTLFYRYVSTGVPVLQPLAYLDQFDTETYNRMDEFGVGEDVVVCPVQEEGCTSRRMYLPSGNWVHYFTGKRQRGKVEFDVETPVEHGIVFVREGAVIPHFPVMQHTAEKLIDVVDLHVWHKHGSHDSQWYSDAGDGYGYQEDAYCLRTFSFSGSATEIRLRQVWEGGYRGPCRQFRVVLRNLPFEPGRLFCDGEELFFRTVPEGFACNVRENFGELVVKEGAVAPSENMHGALSL